MATNQKTQVLISSIGKGRSRTGQEGYEHTEYIFGHHIEPISTSFFPLALTERLHFDQVFIFGTKESMWQEAALQFELAGGKSGLYDKFVNETAGDLSQESLGLLEQIIEEYLRSRGSNDPQATCIIIDAGKNELEIQENFEKIMQISSKIADGSEILLDITHAFRSIPIFLYALVDFLETVRGQDQVSLKRIYYGMYVPQENKSQVVDLSSVYTLTNWSHSLDNFIKFGNGFGLAEQIEDDELSDYILDISVALQTNNFQQLKSLLASAQEYLSRIKDTLSSPDKYINQYLDQFLERMQQPSTHDLVFEMAKWSLENKQYNNFYLYLVEAIHLLLMNVLDLNQRKNSRKINDQINHAINYLEHHGSSKEFKELGHLINDIKDYRNGIAHPNKRSGKGKRKTLYEPINQTEKIYKEIENKMFAESAPEKLKSELAKFHGKE